MAMNLKFYVNKEGKKIYTLNEEIPNSNEKTKDAHYKFIKVGHTLANKN